MFDCEHNLQEALAVSIVRFADDVVATCGQSRSGYKVRVIQEDLYDEIVSLNLAVTGEGERSLELFLDLYEGAQLTDHSKLEEALQAGLNTALGVGL